MKKALLYLIIYLGLAAQPLRALEYPLPKDFKIDVRKGSDAYIQYVIPCINWLQQMPLGEHKDERARITNFVLTWLQINPDINIGLPDYSYTFHGINDQLLYMFMASWIKYTMETKDTNLTNCRLAGIHGMLDYYGSGKAVGMGKNEFLENLAAIEHSGKLAELFDTTNNAKNTWIYLKAPAQKNYKYNENYLGFTFYCINLLQPRKIVYRYLLNGYYDKWIETKDGSANYPRLPPGDYTFVVQELAALLHTLAGVSGNIGINTVYPDAQKLSQLLKTISKETDPHLAPEVAAQIKELARVVASQIVLIDQFIAAVAAENPAAGSKALQKLEPDSIDQLIKLIKESDSRATEYCEYLLSEFDLTRGQLLTLKQALVNLNNFDFEGAGAQFYNFAFK